MRLAGYSCVDGSICHFFQIEVLSQILEKRRGCCAEREQAFATLGGMLKHDAVVPDVVL